MEKEQKSHFIIFAILFFMIGFAIGTLFYDYVISDCGIPETSYCKEIQIDTIQYNYKQNLYKYKIEIIK